MLFPTFQVAVLVAFSTHGFVIALLQFAFVLGLLWLQAWWRRKRVTAGKPDDPTVSGLLVLLLLVEFAVLRYQPIRMGGDPFEYTLGLFDAFTAAGVAMLLILHRAHVPRADPS